MKLHQNRNYSRFIVGFLASSTLAAGGAYAQIAPSNTPADVSAAIEDIIVTAQRRSESLQRTPVAVSVLSGETLARQAITSERDLQVAAPGLTVRTSQNANQINYSLRGQTVDTYSSSVPAVLPYFNEVQVGGPGQSAFYDLQSIQVVKGPQGTLFGRNSTGGAVLFTTAKPTDQLAGYATARYGNYNAVQIEGAVSGALVPGTLKARIAGVYSRRDGYQDNLFNGSKLGGFERKAARLSLKFTPGASFTNDLVVDYLKDDGKNVSDILYNTLPTSANVPGYPFVPVNALFPIAQFAAAQQARGPFTVDVNSLTDHHLTKYIVSNITSFEIAPDTTIKNVLGFVHSKSLDGVDLDGTPLSLVGYGSSATGLAGGFNTNRQFSEELQLLGKLAAGRLEYVAGVYAASSREHNRNKNYLLEPFGFPPQVSAGTIMSRSIAGYAQATLDTGLASFKLTGGLRYTVEQVKNLRDSDDAYSALTNPAYAPFYADGRFIPLQKDTFRKFSWTVGVQNQVTSGLLLYANARRSFRSGGFSFNGPPTPGFAEQSGDEFRPEVATDVEFGAKYRGVLGDVPVSVNVALYNMWVDNVQRSYYAAIYGNLANITVNVPKAEVTGFEIDGNIRPAHWLSLGGNVNYTNARFTSDNVSILSPDGGAATAIYNTYPDAPRWSGLIYADITLPVNDEFNAVLHGDVFSQTSNYFSSTGLSLNPGTKIADYSIANFRIGLESSAGRGWSLSGVVKNAFKKIYYTGGVPFTSLFSFNLASPGEPRTFLAEIRYRF